MSNPEWLAPAPPDRTPRRITIAVLVVLAAGTVGVVALVWLLFDGAVLSRGDAATEQRPPSERGVIASTSVPAAVDRQNRESSAARSGATFAELDCSFEATSTLEPPLQIGLPFGGGSHRMGLQQGARFDCTDGSERSAGTIELDATFDQLNAFNGVTTGRGRIHWTELALGRQVPGEPTATSSTAVEIQLDYPVIVVWTTILDGPFEGYRGRLVFRDWAQVHDDVGDISGIRFARTSTTFAPT